MSHMSDILNSNPLLIPLAKALRELRTREKLTQLALAKQAQVSRQEISEMENARFTGSIAKVSKVLNVLRYQLAVEVRRFPTIDEIDEIFNED